MVPVCSGSDSLLVLVGDATCSGGSFNLAFAFLFDFFFDDLGGVDFPFVLLLVTRGDEVCFSSPVSFGIRDDRCDNLRGVDFFLDTFNLLRRGSV